MSGDQVDSPYRNPQTARIVEEGLVRLRQLEINRKKESPSPPVRMVEGKRNFVVAKIIDTFGRS